MMVANKLMVNEFIVDKGKNFSSTCPVPDPSITTVWLMQHHYGQPKRKTNNINLSQRPDQENASGSFENGTDFWAENISWNSQVCCI